MEIKASQVKELRDMTGVAMMDCKKAVVECEGDIEKALDLLRSNSARTLKRLFFQQKSKNPVFFSVYSTSKHISLPRVKAPVKIHKTCPT